MKICIITIVSTYTEPYTMSGDSDKIVNILTSGGKMCELHKQTWFLGNT